MSATIVSAKLPWREDVRQKFVELYGEPAGSDALTLLFSKAVSHRDAGFMEIARESGQAIRLQPAREGETVTLSTLQTFEATADGWRAA